MARSRRSWLATVVGGAAALLLAGCGDDPVSPEERVATVSVSPDSAALTEIGGTRSFSATARDDAGERLPQVRFEWSSSDRTVATVSPDGRVTAGSEGTAEIRASAGGVADTASLIVDEPAEPTGPPPQDQDTRVVKGQIDAPEGSPVEPVDMTVSSLVDEDVTDSTGDYAVHVHDAEAPSFVGAFSPDGDVVMMAAAFPGEGTADPADELAWSRLLDTELRTDARATAEALVFSTPVFGGASADDYRRARDAIEGSARFAALVSRVESFLRSPSELDQGLFGDEVYADLAPLAEEVAVEALGGSPSGGARGDLGPVDDDPTFSLNESGEIVVHNPDMVHRGVQFVDPLDGTESGALVPRTTIDWVFDVPPLEFGDARKTLGPMPGMSDVWVSSGFNFDEPLDAENWRPGLLNLGTLGTFAIDLIGPDVPGVEELPQCVLGEVAAGGAGRIEGVLNGLLAIRDNGGLAGVAAGTAVNAVVDHLTACVPAVADTQLKDAFAELFETVWDAAFDVLTAGKAVQFVNDWMIEDALTDTPFPDGLGGRYVQRYALFSSGDGLTATRGGALFLDWSPNEPAEFVLDGAGASVAGPPTRRYDLRKGTHQWSLRGDFRNESGSFEVQRAGWHTESLDLIRAVDVAISPTSASLAVNQTQQFSATGLDAEGNEVGLPAAASWSSTDPAVAEVDDSGVATALSPGQTEIVVEVPDVGTASAVLEVIAAEATPSASADDGEMNPEGPDSGTMELCVTVFGVDGEKIAGLGASAYSIPDVSTGGGILQFTARTVSKPSCPQRGPLSAALVVDQSGSMSSSDPSEARLTGVKQFAREMTSGDEVALFTFDDVVRQRSGFTSSPTGLDDAVDALGFPGGRTAVYDAGVEACDFVSASARNSNRAIMLLSDGLDNESTASLSDLVDFCSDRGVRVYTAGFADSPPENLAEIAGRTGGRAVFSQEVDIILSAIRALPATIRGDVCPDCVEFDVAATGLDLTQGGTASGTVSADLSATAALSAGVVRFYNATVDQVNTVSAPFHVEWSATAAAPAPGGDDPARRGSSDGP